ncbi:MAG TPA: thiamine pyrophosphate-dependent enzyme [Chitinispirillaceae bacterium]|nr:thiamine pyrophosphate-dependent enzyme [Chitinispirillaceae bacterium]
MSDFTGALKPSWCKGCSYFIYQKALTEALQQLNFDPLRTALVSGIGCSSRTVFYTNTFGMHTLHGRAIPVATGLRLSRPDIPVIVAAGDGDLFSIGCGHFVHAARNDTDITVFCLNNMMFAMTKNQSSPTSPVGHVGSFTPSGTLNAPLNLVEFAICSKASFVARTTTFSPEHLLMTMTSALKHKGFSFVDIIAPCRTFDNKHYLQENKLTVIDINAEFKINTGNYDEALHFASLNGFSPNGPSCRLPIGTFFDG